MEYLPNLLIVDDTFENLLLIESVIKDVKVNLIKATSGIEALEKVRGLDIALAIIDVRMPVMDGYELASKINGNRVENKVPIIFLTAINFSNTDISKGYNASAVDYIFKPFNINHLLSKINIFLNLFNQKQTIIREAALLKKTVNELERVNAALKKSEEKYRSYINNTPEGVFVTDETGQVIEVNDAASSITGYTLKKLLKMSITEILPKESLNDGLVFFKKVVESGTLMAELMFIHQNGSKRWWTIDALKLSDVRILAFTRDITERKKAENDLKQTSWRLDLATRAGGIGVWDLDIINNNLIWDDYMFSLYGLDKKKFTHSYDNWFSGLHPEDKKRSEEEIQMAIVGEKEFDTEFRVCWPDGSVHNIKAIAIVVRDNAGIAQHMIGTNWDITEQKQLEADLQSSETNFRTFFESMSSMVIVGNTQEEIIYVNNALCNKLEYSREELLGMHVLDLNPVSMRNEAVEILKEIFAGKRDYCPLPVARKDGSLIPVETRIWFGKWNGKDCIFGLAKDLSVEQEALQKFNKIFNSNPTLMAISTIPDGIFTDVNDIFLTKTAYSKDEVIGKTAKDLGLFVHPDAQNKAAIDLVEKGYMHNVELKLKSKSGKILDGLFSGEIIESQGRKFFLTVMVDITERKSSEKEINLINSFLDSIVENIPNMIFIKDAKTLRFVRFNRAGEDLLGIPRQELLGKNDYDIFSKEQADFFIEKDTKVLENKVMLDITEESIQTRHLGKRILHTKKVPLMNSKGELEYLLGISEDITERKMVEDELRESKFNLEEAQRIAHVGSWEWDIIANTVKWSKEMFNVFDIDPKTFEGDPETLIKRLHPDDLDQFIQNMSNISSKQIPSLEYRVIHKDASVHYVFAEGKMELDEAGKLVRSVGTVQDITERKIVEQALKISEEKYRTMLNASPDGILLVNLKGIITEISEIGLGLFGTDTRDDLLCKNISQFVPSDELNTISEIFEKTMSEGLVQNIALKIRKINQSVFLAETSVTLIQDSVGLPLSFMIIIRDISQRTKLETKQIHADRMANLGEMASGIAHEINQPLNIISMVMDKILYETNKTASIDLEFLKTKSNKIFENIIRIRNIIDHIRAFSRTHDDYILSAFDVNLSIENAVSMITEQFKHLGINLVLELGKRIPQISGNTYKFEQVILNLLVNAKDAVVEKKREDDESYELMITIKSYLENQFLIVEVTDNGSGISENDINNIILPFYTTKDEGKGTGLGLSICYQIIKEMNGSIDIISNELDGTKVRIIIEIEKK